jgi:integration host factor subunit beta
MGLSLMSIVHEHIRGQRFAEKAMIKSELMVAIAKKLTHIPEKDIVDAVNHIIDLMSNTLGRGERIEIRGFGSFCLHYRPPRYAHNPKTGEKVLTAPKYSPYFKPGKELRERVNANRHLPIREGSAEDESESSMGSVVV